MPTTRFGYFSSSKAYSFHRGFSLIEILVGTFLFLVIGLAGYQVYTKSVKKAVVTQQQTKFSRVQKQFFDAFRHQVENIPQIPKSQNTVLQVTRPVVCSDADTVTEVGWGLIPLPGYDMAAVTALPAFQAIDPELAVVNDTDHANDAVTMVYMPAESKFHLLAIDAGGVPWSTIQNSPNDHILLETADDLEVGDFAIVADSSHRELIRITGKVSLGTDWGIRHSYTVSAWNQQMTYKIGGTQNSAMGRPILYRVKIATYALDTTNKNLMLDDHVKDDGFDASTKAFGIAGLAHNWQVVAPDITKFQLYYVLTDEFGGVETRTPQAGIPGEGNKSCASYTIPNCDCGSQLGRPGLRSIRTNIEYNVPSVDSSQGPITAKDTVQQFNPEILKEALPTESSAVGCDISGSLYSTEADGVTHNTNCPADTSAEPENAFCLCSDRPCDLASGNCWLGGGGTSGGGYGGGGSG